MAGLAMAFAVVTGICIALVSPMPVIASAAPRAAVARSRFGIMLMIDSYVGPSAGPCSDKCPSFRGVPQRAQPTLRDGQLRAGRWAGARSRDDHVGAYTGGA